MIGIALDVETGGLDYETDEILQIGAVAFNNETFEYKAKFSTLVRPIRVEDISLEALDVNGLSIKDLTKAPTPMEVRRLFMSWHEEVLNGEKMFPLGFNYSFDKNFLVRFFGFDIYSDLFYYKHRDAFVLGQGMVDAGLIKMKRHRLKDYAEKFSVACIEHDALGDSFATLNVYSNLIKVLQGKMTH